MNTKVLLVAFVIVAAGIGLAIAAPTLAEANMTGMDKNYTGGMMKDNMTMMDKNMTGGVMQGNMAAGG
jgi:hypothetical protein